MGCAQGPFFSRVLFGNKCGGTVHINTAQIQSLSVNSQSVEIKSMNQLQSKKAFVTGGTRGIGKGIVLALAKAGADVAFTFRSSLSEANDIKTELEEEFPLVYVHEVVRRHVFNLSPLPHLCVCVCVCVSLYIFIYIYIFIYVLYMCMCGE